MDRFVLVMKIRLGISLGHLGRPGLLIYLPYFAIIQAVRVKDRTAFLFVIRALHINDPIHILLIADVNSSVMLVFLRVYRMRLILVAVGGVPSGSFFGPSLFLYQLMNDTLSTSARWHTLRSRRSSLR
jgi:hypothetical protein